MNQELNHPVAVIAILAGLAVLLREISWFVKSVQGKANPYSDTQRTFERLSETLQAVHTSLMLMNSKLDGMQHNQERLESALRDCQKMHT